LLIFGDTCWCLVMHCYWYFRDVCLRVASYSPLFASGPSWSEVVQLPLVRNICDITNMALVYSHSGED
jgi:hypothetical protein